MALAVQGPTKEHKSSGKQPATAPAHTGAEPYRDTSESPLFLGGNPLQPGLLSSLERSFGTSLSSVRVHNDSRAHGVAGGLSARALTYGNAIFLNRGESAHDPMLMGHEVAHTIQQRGGPVIAQGWSAPAADRFENEAHRAGGAAARGEQFHVNERTAGPRVQRLGLSDVLDYFADKANMIPGYRMFTLVIGINPINMSKVERTTANILRALVELIPLGGIISQVLDRYGVFDKVAAWIDPQISALGISGSAIRAAIDAFLDSLHLSDILHPGDVWDRAKRIFTDPIGRIIDLGKSVVTGILRFVREAVLKPLAALAAKTSGYDLLKAVMGEDPVTGEPVPRNAETLIGGFMKLIGQEEVWENIKRGHAIDRAWAWFQNALLELLGFVRQIPGLFMQALSDLEFSDFLVLPSAFIKLGRVFANFAGKFLSWALKQVLSLLQIIVEVVAPGVMPYIRKAAGAFNTIIKDPMGFVGNLVRAGKQGFNQFGSNFLSHLRNALIQWLTGTMAGAGIYIPQAFEIREIIKFVLSVLGLTWQQLRVKLVSVVGETAVKAMETGFDIVVTLVRDGPAAAWEKIKEEIGNLKEMVMEQVISFVKERIITAAIQKLVTSLNPAGAFIQAIIATYNTVMFFVERLQQIAKVAMAFIDSIAAIASGNIANAANKVEQTMAGLLVLVISCLARLVGLGKVSDAVINIINKVRDPIMRARDRIIDWIVAMARKAGRFVAQVGVPQDPGERLRLGMRAAKLAVRAGGAGSLNAGTISQLVAGVRVRYAFTSLEAVNKDGDWYLRGTINPSAEELIGKNESQILIAIRQVADAEYDAIKPQPLVGSGVAGDPHIVPVGGGVGAVARTMEQALPPGQRNTRIFDVSQGGNPDLQGKMLANPMRRRIEGEVFGATPAGTGIDIGRYPAVANTLAALGKAILQPQGPCAKF